MTEIITQDYLHTVLKSLMDDIYLNEIFCIGSSGIVKFWSEFVAQ